jgi:radical SAM superfamily enzyme YgiQ (UPF0313 family)
MNKKILLYYPRLTDATVADQRSIPLGLVNLLSVLKSNDIESEIFDQSLLGTDNQYLINYLKKYNYTHVGISVCFPNPAIVLLIKTLRAKMRNIRIIAGGPTASYLYAQLIYLGVDIVIRGEGETPIVKLMKKDCHIELTDSVKKELLSYPGFAFKLGEKIVTTGLNKESKIYSEVYSKSGINLIGYREANLNFSKGCPFSCYFCIVNKYFGRKLVYANPLDIINEIIYVRKKFGIKFFSFVDDIFGLNIERLNEFSKLIIENKLTDISFWVGTRLDNLTNEKVKLFKKIGIKIVGVGIESINEKSQTILRKTETLQLTKNKIDMLKKNGIRAECSIILGLPNETLKDFKNTIDALAFLDVDAVHISTLIIIPGSQLWEDFSSRNIYKKCEFDSIDDYMNWNKYRINYGTFNSQTSSLQDIKEARRYAKKKLGTRIMETKFNDIMRFKELNPFI